MPVPFGRRQNIAILARAFSRHPWTRYTRECCAFLSNLGYVLSRWTAKTLQTLTSSTPNNYHFGRTEIKLPIWRGEVVNDQ